jgi:hypothetical protein
LASLDLRNISRFPEIKLIPVANSGSSISSKRM